LPWIPFNQQTRKGGWVNRYSRQYRVIQTEMNRFYLQLLPQGDMDWKFLKCFATKDDALRAYYAAIQEQNVLEDMKTLKKVIISTEDTK
jgi:hypothetical protein